MASWENAPVVSQGSWEQAPPVSDYEFDRATGAVKLTPAGAMKDWAKSLGSGLVTGAEAVVGFPQDMLDLAERRIGTGVRAAGNAIFGKTENAEAMEKAKAPIRLLPTSQDVAGAVVDGQTMARAERAGVSVTQALQENNAYPLFRQLRGHIRTGPTGTNVNDLYLLLLL